MPESGLAMNKFRSQIVKLQIKRILRVAAMLAPLNAFSIVSGAIRCRPGNSLILSAAMSVDSIASLAAQRQQQVPDSQMAVVAPYIAASVQVGHHPTTGRIALHLQTSEGIPLHIAMDRELVETTISLLQSELATSPDASKKLS
ncbi:MAG: hypothetical protein ACLP4V_30750 [Methylocella sp.]